VSEDDVDGADHRLELGADAEQSRQFRNHAAPAVGQRLRVVAEDLEHPEDQRRSRNAGHLAVAALQQREDAAQVCRLSHIVGRVGLAVDILEHDGTGFVVQDGRRQLGGGGGLAGSQLVKSQNSVHDDVVADADEMPPTAVGHDEVGVGDAALQRLGCDRAGPAESAAARARGSILFIAVMRARTAPSRAGSRH